MPSTRLGARDAQAPIGHVGEVDEDNVEEVGTPEVAEDDPIEDNPEETVEETIQRLEAEKQALRNEERARELQLEVQSMKRRRDRLDAGAAAAIPLRPIRLDGSATGDDDSVSLGGSSVAQARSGHPGRPKVKDPKPFRGESIKEAREFIRHLKMVFVNSNMEHDDRKKVLYSAMWLGGDAAESWHNEHDIEALAPEYTWADFQAFVRNTVGDPANRQLSVILEYEKARQGQHQTAKAFDLELEVLESQLDYTPAQLVRQYLAKLKPALRTDIIKNHTIPATRVEMVALARRIEASDNTGAASTLAGTKRGRSDSDTQGPGHRSSHSKVNHNKGRDRRSEAKKDSGDASANRRRRGGSTDTVVCYNCDKPGHIRPDCTKEGGGKYKASVSKVTAGDSEKEKASRKKPDL